VWWHVTESSLIPWLQLLTKVSPLNLHLLKSVNPEYVCESNDMRGCTVSITPFVGAYTIDVQAGCDTGS
jgi:hypothetical protein